MEICNMDEAGVEASLLDGAKANGVTAPRVIVVNRQQKPNSMTRTVRFALLVPINNEPLIDTLNRIALDNDLGYYFIGSETNLQNDAMEIDYLFFEAKIMVKN